MPAKQDKPVEQVPQEGGCYERDDKTGALRKVNDTQAPAAPETKE